MTQQISITALAPVIRQSADSYNERLATSREGYTSSAAYGYDACHFNINGIVEHLRGWFRAGLVRDIIWKAPNSRTIWNGYIESMTLREGHLTRTKSITRMANRVVFIYTELDTSTNPPTAGEQKTITVNDTTSQSLYGIKSATISGGETTTTAAAVQAATELTKLSRIAIDESVIIGSGGSAPTLQIRCKGYSHMLNWNNYTQTASSGDENISTTIAAIIAADENSVVSASTNGIETNTTQSEKYYDGKRPMWRIIQTLLERGGVNEDKYVAGIYEGRKLTYKQAETVDANNNPATTNVHLTLSQNPADKAGVILDQAGHELRSWDIKPDRLLYSSAYGREPKFINQVVWSAPDTVRMRNTDINPLRGAVL